MYPDIMMITPQYSQRGIFRCIRTVLQMTHVVRWYMHLHIKLKTILFNPQNHNLATGPERLAGIEETNSPKKLSRGCFEELRLP